MTCAHGEVRRWATYRWRGPRYPRPCFSFLQKALPLLPPAPKTPPPPPQNPGALCCALLCPTPTSAVQPFSFAPNLLADTEGIVTSTWVQRDLSFSLLLLLRECACRRERSLGTIFLLICSGPGCAGSPVMLLSAGPFFRCSGTLGGLRQGSWIAKAGVLHVPRPWLGSHMVYLWRSRK